ncbi:hypothetical protein ACOSQ3_029749 [Xanthoceras sorbifolium]
MNSDKIAALCAALNLSDDEGPFCFDCGLIGHSIHECPSSSTYTTSADAFTHKYGVWLRAANPPLPRERFNCSTRGQEFSRGTRTTEEGERDTVRGGETVVRDPVSETPQQVSFKGKEKVGRTVPVSSSTAAIVNHPDIFPSSSPIVCNASEILSPHIPPIAEPFVYGIGGGPKPVFETVNLRSYMQKDVGSGSLDRPLLDDTLTVPIDPGPSGVTHKIVDPLEYHNAAPPTDCHVVTSHAISGTDVHPRSSRWKRLARKGKQYDMPEVGHSDEAPVSKRQCSSDSGQALISL